MNKSKIKYYYMDEEKGEMIYKLVTKKDLEECGVKITNEITDVEESECGSRLYVNMHGKTLIYQKIHGTWGNPTKII